MHNFILLGLAMLVFGAKSEEESREFIQIEDNNFLEFMDEYPLNLILFKNNNCRFCAEFLKKVPQLASRYFKRYPDFRMAVINYEGNEEFLKELGVTEFPHLRLNTGSGFYAIFQHLFAEDRVSSFLKEHLHFRPSVKNIEQDNIYQSLLNEKLAAYFSFPSVTKADLKKAQDFSRAFPDIPVYIGESFSQNDKDLLPNEKRFFRFVLKRSFDNGNKIIAWSEPLNPLAISELTYAYRDPIVRRADPDLIFQIFQTQHNALVLFDKNEETIHYKNFREGVKESNKKMLHLFSDLTESNSNTLGSVLGVTSADFPAVYLISFEDRKLRRYKFTDSIREDEIRVFLYKFEDKKLPVYYRSDADFDNTGKKVLEMSRNQMQELKANNSNTLILVYYSLYNPEVQNFLDAFESFANSVLDENVVFARTNIDKNDFEEFNLSQLPGIELYRDGKKLDEIFKYARRDLPEDIQFLLELKLKITFNTKKVSSEL